MLLIQKGLLQPEHELPMADIIAGFLHPQNPDVAGMGNGTGIAAERSCAMVICPLEISSRRPSMIRLLTLAVFALLVGATATPASAADVTEVELMQAATSLAQQYDSNYAARNSVGMAALYASDGVLVSPSGPIVRGRQALTTYYDNRFASGARGHAIKVVEVHVQGDGGYGLTQFSVTVPGANGNLREEHGSIVVVYRRDADGWHMRLVQPSVPPTGQ
jgi:uncharacterized protein (TIGR02246 family)